MDRKLAKLGSHQIKRYFDLFLVSSFTNCVKEEATLIELDGWRRFIITVLSRWMNQDMNRCCVKMKRGVSWPFLERKTGRLMPFTLISSFFPLQHFMCVSIRHETFKYVVYISWWRIATETKRMQTASSLTETWENWRMKPIPNTWD